ncbi:hypothetical protein AN2V17_38850 [Vallitalea sp. AN17-2]|uniref:Uncharacterized protein n=1 Tax=Vallitalea maricola TaxID=3074433 RepID=A0ACB5UNT2_9FIRM|nr:hypothetical protein AN2V17_38850 [Vallitalea sp. AN17-2]
MVNTKNDPKLLPREYPETAISYNVTMFATWTSFRFPVNVANTLLYEVNHGSCHYLTYSHDK